MALQPLNTSLLLANTSQDLISAKVSPHCTNHLHGPHIKCIITLLKQERSVVEFPAGEFANVFWKKGRKLFDHNNGKISKISHQ